MWVHARSPRRVTEAVLTSTHNQCFGSKLGKGIQGKNSDVHVADFFVSKIVSKTTLTLLLHFDSPP